MIQIYRITRWTLLLLYLVWPLQVHAASIADEERFSNTTITFLGVFSTTLDSISRDILTDKIKDLIQQDEELSLNDWTSHRFKLDKIYRKKRAFQGSGLRRALPDENIHHLIYISFERFRKIFICRIMNFSLKKGNSVEIANFSLVADVSKHIRNAADYILEELQKYFGIESETDNPVVLYKFSSAIVDAMVLKGDRIIQKDSVWKLRKGTTLKLGGNSGTRYLSGRQFKYLLFPNSAFTFLDHHVVQIDIGRFGTVNMGRKTTLVTPYAVIQLEKAISEVNSLELETHFRVFTGKAVMTPIMDQGNPETINGRISTMTRGYTVSQKEMADTALIQGFKPFKAVMTSGIVRQFKTANATIFEEIVSDVNYFKSGSEDPMDYFIAAGLSELGIPMDALLLESEAWRPGIKVFKPAINETGCYLCKPNRIGPDKP